MSGATSGESPGLKVAPGTLHLVSAALEQTASAFHDEIVQLSARGDALLETLKGRAGPTFVEPFEDWKNAANDVIERLRATAILISEVGTAYAEADRP